MRLIYFAGIEKLGCTSLIISILKKKKLKNVGVIAHNLASSMELSDYCKTIDAYPVKPCCARPRMLSFRMDKLLENNNLECVITEPPGISTETAAPILNQMFAFRKEIQISPLTTLVDWNYILENEIEKTSLKGLSLYNQINESDIVVAHKSDLIDKEKRKIIIERIRKINPVCKIFFTSSVTDENINALLEELLSGKYARPLNN